MTYAALNLVSDAPLASILLGKGLANPDQYDCMSARLSPLELTLPGFPVEACWGKRTFIIIIIITRGAKMRSLSA
jgi:hypothetical protein